MNSTLNNHATPRTRKPSLSEQIDRLNTILDGLAEAIPGAVETAVRQTLTITIKQVVQAAVTEALDRVHTSTPPAPPPVPPAPSLWQTLKGKFRAFRDWVGGKLTQGQQAVCTCLSATGQRVSTSWSWLQSKCCAGWTSVRARCHSGWQTLKRNTVGRVAQAWRWTKVGVQLAWTSRKATGLALTVGLLAGSISYLAGPLFASLSTGLGAALLMGVYLWALPVIRLLRGEAQG